MSDPDGARGERHVADAVQKMFPATNVPGPSAPGDGYQFNPDELKGVIQDWKNLRAKFLEAYNAAVPMTQVQAMGDEPASHGVTNKANLSGAAYQQENRAMQDYCTDQIKKLQATLDAYTAQEQHATDTVNKINRGL
jgi:PE family